MSNGRSLKALNWTSPLEPEVRLAQAVSEFGAILSGPHKVSFRALASRSPPSIADVIKLTEEVNLDGSRHHKSWIPYGTRLVGILEKVQVLSQAGDVVIGGSQNLIASGVWGVVRLSLLVAIGYLSFFDKLSAFLMRLGNSSAVTRDLALLHPQSRELQKLMSEYLITLVSFCTRIVTFAQSSRLSQITNSIFTSFDKEFNGCETELRHWSLLIERRVAILIHQSQQDTASALERANRSLDIMASSDSKNRAMLLLKRKEEILELLCPRQHEYNLAWRRQRKKGTPRWIFANDTYQQWKASSTSTTLWISGKLGSGKTVILASIIGDSYGTPGTRPALTATNSEPFIAFFFCSSEDHGSLKPRNIFGSIVRQILSTSDPDSEPLKTAEKFLQSYQSLSTEDILELLLTVLPESQPIFLIIDALDELSGHDLGEAVQSLKQLLTKRMVRLCCSSRTDSSAYRTASSSLNIDHQISATNLSADSEMAAFIDRELQQRKHIYNLSPETEGLMKDILIAGAYGMYLWVTLQISTVLPLYDSKILSESDIRGILVNLPENLPAAFDRALDRIADKRYGSTIFQLVTAAQRPLSTQELRVALNVAPGNTNWDVTTLPYDARLVVGACGGGLLEIDEESSCVHFIHHSAVQHLITDSVDPDNKQHCFTLDQAHLRLGSICVTYLHYGVFDSQIIAPRILKVDVSKFTNRVTEAATASNSITSKLMSTFKGRQHQHPQSLNIGRVIQQYDKTPRWTDVHYFLNYAKDHWISHTNQFSESACPHTYNFFIKHVLAPMPHVNVPWERDSMEACLQWAIESGHQSIFSHFVLEENATEGMIQNAVQILTRSPTRFNINCQKLDQILVKFLDANCLDVEAIKRLLELGANVNQGVVIRERWNELSPLALAILQMHEKEKWDYRLVELLLEAGADPNGASHGSPCLPLTIAIYSLWTTVVKLLVENGATVKYSLESGIPFAMAVKIEKADILEVLLPADLNPFELLLEGQSAFRLAARKDFFNLMKILIRRAQSNHDGLGQVLSGEGENNIFLLAVKYKNLSTAKVILDGVGNWMNWETALLNRALRILVTYDSYEPTANALITGIVKLGADPNGTTSDGNTMIATALKQNSRYGVEALITNGGDPNFRCDGGMGYPLIIEASSRGWDNVVRALLQSGVSPNEAFTVEHDNITSCCTAFCEAIRQHNPEVLETLLEWNGDPNAPCHSLGVSDMTPLVCAIHQKSRKMIELLLRSRYGITTGADLNLPGPSSPLLVACQEFAKSNERDFWSTMDVLSFLIEQGAIFSSGEEKTRTMDALCLAARSGQFEVFKGIYDLLDNESDYKQRVVRQIRLILSEDSISREGHRKIRMYISNTRLVPRMFSK
ncbi:hypothetical protein GGR51DRAFT_504813 [Nemania sp. FL0031]|nr:hypothetical protein GGR51DRAFT_504813 [Nemania sp. FL0031]